MKPVAMLGLTLAVITCVDPTMKIAHAQIANQAWNIMDAGNQGEFPSDAPDAHEIWLYTDSVSYQPGDEVVFYAHSTSDSFDLNIARDGAELVQVHAQSGIPGARQETPVEVTSVGAGWSETFRFKIPEDWTSGVYVVTAKIVDADRGEARAEHIFVVRPGDASDKNRIAFMLATSTYVAYNDWGKANAYRTNNTPEPQRIGSFDRPWARGFVSLPVGAPRHGQAPRPLPFENPRFETLEWSLTNGYSRHYADAGWAYYDGPFARWMEREGYLIDYITQHDLHHVPDLLDDYQLVVFGGHDEYWSWEMRDAIDAFVEAGGNVARFGGNMLWQIRLEHGGRTQLMYKHPSEDPLYGTDDHTRITTYWEHPLVNRPAAETFGLTGAAGIYALYGGAVPRGTGGYTVYRPEHWVFAGTDLYFGDVFGERPTSIVAFEVDGIDFTFRDGRPEPTFKDGAPETTVILAMTPAIKGEEDHSAGSRMMNAPLEEAMPAFADSALEPYFSFFDEEEEIYKEGEGLRSMYGNCAIVVMTKGDGTVFNAGTATWVHGLIDGDFYTEQVTRNVINHLARP